MLSVSCVTTYMRIYTKTGDKGETSLFGGKRIKKSCLEIDAVGEVDETNALIGVLVSELGKHEMFDQAKERVWMVQHRLFTIGSNIAAVQMDLGKMPQLTPADIGALESWIDEMEKDLEPLTQFILPGGHEAAGHAFVARAVCRRAERKVVQLVEQYPALSPLLVQYLNRLSDVLFVLARWVNKKSGHHDVTWKK